MEGYEASQVLARALRWVGAWEAKSMHKRRGKGSAMSNAEVCDLAAAHPELRESVMFVTKRGISGKVLSDGEAAFCHWLFHQYNQREADQFMAAVLTGEGVRKGTPTYVLRNRLLDAATYQAHRMQAAERIAVTIKAWNLERTGAKAHGANSIRWRRKVDNYPEPQ